MRRRLATWLLARLAGVPCVASPPREAGAIGLDEDPPLTETTRQVTPGHDLFYDRQGMCLFQPNERFVRDPWRVIVASSAINTGVFRDQIALVRDRCNVRLPVEYVL